MKRFFFVLSFTAFFLSCQGEVNRLSVTAWNVQTFFDGITRGSEYSEFKKSDWTAEKYSARLKKLCEALLEINSDVVVLTEVENENVLRDLQNAFPFGKGYDYGAFGGEKNGVFGIAVLSRFPIVALRTHQVGFHGVFKEKEPSMRPLTEAEIVFGENVVTLLACHWKSKSGGEEESRIWRAAQRALLAEVTANLFDDEAFAAAFSAGDRAVLALGDFNMDFYEFGGEEGFVDFVAGDEFSVFYNPWEEIPEKGSYFFDGSWEKIDHFFVLDNFSEKVRGQFGAENFEVRDGETFVTGEGIPDRYAVFNGRGLSDHLPISVVLRKFDLQTRLQY